MNKRMENAFIQMFKGMFQTVQKAWKKYSPKIKRKGERFWKTTKTKISTGCNWLWSWFVGQTMDRQIAIIISIYTVVTLLFGTLHWLTILCFVLAWGFVYREDYTKPVIVWFCTTTKPIRRRFTIWVCKVLFSDYGFPISMIGWGVVCFSLFGIFLYVDKNVAGIFGMAGFSGIIFGTFFYAVEKYNENCKIKLMQAKHMAKNEAKISASNPSTSP